jgi:outer membrane protein assembly factor BamD (BamD/ComL family)
MLKTTQKAGFNTLLLSFTLLFCSTANSQLMKFDAPLSQLYQNGLKSLAQGDSLAAFQSIQSAHFFDPNENDIAYHFHVLAVALDKEFAIENATSWLEKNKNISFKIEF